jgi:hypothetical protein
LNDCLLVRVTCCPFGILGYRVAQLGEATPRGCSCVRTQIGRTNDAEGSFVIRFRSWWSATLWANLTILSVNPPDE